MVCFVFEITCSDRLQYTFHSPFPLIKLHGSFIIMQRTHRPHTHMHAHTHPHTHAHMHNSFHKCIWRTKCQVSRALTGVIGMAFRWKKKTEIIIAWTVGYSGAPKIQKSGVYCKMEWSHAVLHTCTTILSEHFQAHRHLCTDLLGL